MAGDWKMVPVAPTPKMVKAGRELLGGMVEDADADYRRIYEAMLAASPGLLRTFLDEAEKAGVTRLEVNLPSASEERERFNRWAESAGKFHVSGYNPNDDLWQAWRARAALAPLPGADEAQHVAEVGETFALHWAGRGSIAPLIERHGLKVGSKLYSRPAPSPGVDAFQSSGGNTWKDLFWQVASILKCLPSTFVDANGHVMKAAARAMAAPSPGVDAAEQKPDPIGEFCNSMRQSTPDEHRAVQHAFDAEYPAPSPAASADEWMVEAERLVWALRQSAREDGAQGSDGYDSPSIVAAEKQAASDEAALLAHLKAYPKG